MSTSYRVRWEIDIDAETPREAAEEALAIQRDHACMATVFDIIDLDHIGDEGEEAIVRIDLLGDGS